MQRYGMSIPFAGVPLHEHRDWVLELQDLGYTDLWSSEADGADGFTPLALASTWAPSLRLGVAIIPAFTRGPALLAQTVASLASAAPGRFVLGLGSSSNVIVERWNGIPFDEPYKRTRDTLRFLRAALGGEKVSQKYDTFAVDGFRLALPAVEAVPVLVAALREGMLRLAGREGDGAIINWLSAEDVAKVAPIVHGAAKAAPSVLSAARAVPSVLSAARAVPSVLSAATTDAPKEIVARIFVAPSTDREAVHRAARFMIAAYLNVPVYAAFHEWLGRGPALTPMWEAWQAGDRKAALAAIPDRLVDELFIWGPPEQCREHIQRYIDNGVTTPALAIMRFGDVDPRQAIRDLAPR